MPGTSNKENHHLFEVGEPCIINVDSANTPTGVWWGLVTGIGEKPDSDSHKSHISVDVVITGAFNPSVRATKFGLEAYKPVTGLSKIPSSNFSVYPATKTNIELWVKILKLKQRIKALETSRKIEMDFLQEILGNKK